MGDRVFGPYRLLSQLGQGGMGEVWRALDTRKDREIALKILGSWVGDDPDYARRFRREAALAARLNAPNIVPIHDYGEIDGQLFIDMPLVDGTDLDGLVDREGPLAPARAVGIVDQVADALDVAHRAGLVHRDVKPSNTLVTQPRADRDFVYLIDFGIARAVDSTTISRAGSVIGTPAYMAPERFDGDGDHRGDVYALACMLYAALTGRPPFEPPEKHLVGFVYAHLHAPPPRPSQHNPAVPGAFDAVIARGMAKNPDDRYPSAGALAAAARAALLDATPLRAAAPSHPPNRRETAAQREPANPPEVERAVPRRGAAPSQAAVPRQATASSQAAAPRQAAAPHQNAEHRQTAASSPAAGPRQAGAPHQSAALRQSALPRPYTAARQDTAAPAHPDAPVRGDATSRGEARRGRPQPPSTTNPAAGVPTPLPRPPAAVPPARRGKRVLGLGLAALLAAVAALLGVTGNLPFGGADPAAAGPAFAATPGICATWAQADGSDAVAVDCAQPHLFEQSGQATLPDQPAPPDDAQWRDLVAAHCPGIAAVYLGGALDPRGRYRADGLRPTSAQWTAGYRGLRCGLELNSRSGALYPSTGTVRDRGQSAVEQPGTCLGIDSRTVTDAVPCADVHAVEVVGVVDLAQRFTGGFPSVADQDGYLQSTCGKVAGEYVAKQVIQAAKLTLYWDNLTAASWNAGSREVNCNLAALLPDRSGFAPVTGSVRGGNVTVGTTPALPAPGGLDGVPVPTATPR
jgi:serine/threonine protein kinase